MTDNLPPELLSAAARVLEANRAIGRRIAVAESCTGGLVMAALTEHAGASDVVEAGFVTYANDAKKAMLGVDEDMIATFGAVSVATAWGMAQGALKRCSADIAVAITGVAGPAGGTDKKPVGTVVFARAVRGDNPNDVVADTKQFGDIGRGPIRLQAALIALELLMPGFTPTP